MTLNREIVGAPSTEKLVSVMAVDNSKYLHYRPTLQDGSGEFTISFFRQTATEVLGLDVLGVSALSAAEQEELLEEQVGKQLKIEVKANWYSPGSKYSFAGDITLLLHKMPRGWFKRPITPHHANYHHLALPSKNRA